MNKDANKEKWIDEVMGSTRDMGAAQPPAGLYEKIMDKANSSRKRIQPITLPAARWAAAAAILLLAINVSSIIHAISEKRPAKGNATTSILSEMEPATSYNY